jgi:hypothetical protein
MDERIYELPESARRLVQTIQATLAQAHPLLQAQDAPSELSFTVRETASRYLPDTIDAFLAIPRSQRDVPDDRGQTAVDLLLEQLSVLERSSQRALVDLSAHAKAELAANARFLSERFDERSKEIASPSDARSAVAANFEIPQWFALGGVRAAEIVAAAAEMFGRHLPALTAVRRGGVLGMGKVEAVEVTFPQGGGLAFRYMLSVRDGTLEANVMRLKHGTVVQRVVCTPEEWVQSLYEDVAEHARRNHEMRAAFTSLFNA